MWQKWKDEEEKYNRMCLSTKELRYLDENLMGEYEFLGKIIRYDMYPIDPFHRIVSISKKENKRL